MRYASVWLGHTGYEAQILFRVAFHVACLCCHNCFLVLCCVRRLRAHCLLAPGYLQRSNMPKVRMVSFVVWLTWRVANHNKGSALSCGMLDDAGCSAVNVAVSATHCRCIAGTGTPGQPMQQLPAPGCLQGRCAFNLFLRRCGSVGVRRAACVLAN